MPYINVKVAGPRLEAAHVKALQQGITSLIVEVLHKRASVTAVLVEPVDLASWTIGGAAVPCAAQVDVTVSEGTNTAKEKAQLIAGTHALLREVLGSELPLATYVVIHGLPRDTWGYGGITQAERAQAQP
jgi:4-oxalocrotonate tautomerase